MVGLRETKGQALHPVRNQTRTESVAGDAAQVLQMRLGAGRPSEQRDNCLLLSWTRHVPEFWRRIKLRCLLEPFMRMSVACWGRPRGLSGETGGNRNLNRKKARFARLRHSYEYVLFDTFNRKQ